MLTTTKNPFLTNFLGYNSGVEMNMKMTSTDNGETWKSVSRSFKTTTWTEVQIFDDFGVCDYEIRLV